MSIRHLIVAILLLLPATAFANIPVPTLFGNGAPFYLSMRTMGLIAVAIVAVETVILKYALDLDWVLSFFATLVANVVSSILGFFISSVPACLLSFFLLPIALYLFFKHQMKMTGWKALVLGVIPTVCTMAWLALSYQSPVVETWKLYASLVPAFLLSVLIEATVLFNFHKHSQILKWTFIANAASYLILVVAMFLFSYRGVDNPALYHLHFLWDATRYANEGDVDRTMEVLEKLREHEGTPTGIAIHDHLRIARTFLKNGDKAAAREILEEVKAIDLSELEVKEELEQEISQLEKSMEQEREPETNRTEPNGPGPG